MSCTRPGQTARTPAQAARPLRVFKKHQQTFEENMKTATTYLQQLTAILPGLIIALLIATVAKWFESLLPYPVLRASVIALFIGMALHRVCKSRPLLAPGLAFSSKKVLRLAIILLGASLSIGTILHVGKISLAVMVFTLLTCFGGGYLVGRLLKLNWKLSNLISAGTGICGSSAIAAIAPVIDAEDKDIAYAMSATFLFDIAMIVLFPLMGKWLNLTDMAYGLWAGTAVNDTASVVAAGYAFSERAGDFATMVKLTRTLAIIPTVLIFSIVHVRLQRQSANANAGAAGKSTVKMRSLIPWFIVGFVALALVNSTGIVPPVLASAAKHSSKFLMVAALAAIGLKTDVAEMHRAGANPMIHGFVISTLVVIVALAVEIAMGIV